MSFLDRLNQNPFAAPAIDLKQVEADEQAIQKMNKNHGKDGRFSSGAGGNSISQDGGDGHQPGSGGGSAPVDHVAAVPAAIDAFAKANPDAPRPSTAGATRYGNRPLIDPATVGMGPRSPAAQHAADVARHGTTHGKSPDEVAQMKDAAYERSDIAALDHFQREEEARRGSPATASGTAESRPAATAGLRAAHAAGASAPAAKGPKIHATYDAAHKSYLEGLKNDGWDVKTMGPSGPLKVPHATSPSGKTRLYFKTQSIYRSVDNNKYGMPQHDMGRAHSITQGGDSRHIKYEDFRSFHKLPKKP
jgi:hypothetical protein